MRAVKFEWDEAKRLSNIAKHDIDFGRAITIFRSDPYIIPARPSGTEERGIAIGPLTDILIAVIYTQREDVWRIISARRARDNERRRYQALHG